MITAIAAIISVDSSNFTMITLIAAMIFQIPPSLPQLQLYFQWFHYDYSDGSNDSSNFLMITMIAAMVSVESSEFTMNTAIADMVLVITP